MGPSRKLTSLRYVQTSATLSVRCAAPRPHRFTCFEAATDERQGRCGGWGYSELHMIKITLEQLALEIEDLIRTMPGDRDFVRNPDKCIPWLGRACAAMNAWDSPRAMVHFDPLVRQLSKSGNFDFSPTRRSLLVQLHQAQSDLRLQSTGPLSVGIQIGRVFDYFDEIRRMIESAKIDLLFVDAYIDAEFVSRYLPHVSVGTCIRILAREKLSSLKPAVASFVAQNSRQVEIRTAPGFHDRYVFVDGLACFQSGASFKDGAKKAPTTLTQITDAFAAVRTTYEQIWTQATVVTT
jgi:hypothetical protein